MMGGGLDVLIDFFQNATLLRIVWSGSLFLGALSSLGMIGLVLFRIRSHRADIKRNARLKFLRPHILQFLDGNDDLSALKEVCEPADCDLVREIIMSLLGSVKGDSHDLLVDLLKEIGARDEALLHLRRGSDLEKLQAIEVLSLFSDVDAIDALHAALEDESMNVRLMAAEALSEIDPYLRLSELIEKLDIGGAARSRILREIFRQVGARHTEDLVALLKKGCNDHVAMLVLYAIGRAQDYASVPMVMAQMEKESVDVRAEALRALAAIGHPSSKPAVIKGLQDPAWPVRAQAAVCAGRIGFGDTVDLLSALLDDPEWWVRFRAAEALFDLGKDGVHALEVASRAEQGRAAQISTLVLSERKVA